MPLVPFSPQIRIPPPILPRFAGRRAPSAAELLLASEQRGRTKNDALLIALLQLISGQDQRAADRAQFHESLAGAASEAEKQRRFLAKENAAQREELLQRFNLEFGGATEARKAAAALTTAQANEIPAARKRTEKLTDLVLRGQQRERARARGEVQLNEAAQSKALSQQELELKKKAGFQRGQAFVADKFADVLSALATVQPGETISSRALDEVLPLLPGGGASDLLFMPFQEPGTRNEELKQRIRKALADAPTEAERIGRATALDSALAAFEQNVRAAKSPGVLPINDEREAILSRLAQLRGELRNVAKGSIRPDFETRLQEQLLMQRRRSQEALSKLRGTIQNRLDERFGAPTTTQPASTPPAVRIVAPTTQPAARTRATVPEPPAEDIPFAGPPAPTTTQAVPDAQLLESLDAILQRRSRF